MTGPDNTLLHEIRAALSAAADPAVAEPMQRYMKSAMPYYGVRMPEVRRRAKAVFDAHRLDDPATWEATVRSIYDQATHREERYAALSLLAHRYYRGWAVPGTLALHEHLIRTGAWWDLVDETSHRVGDLLLEFRPEVEPALRDWAEADDLWIRRSSIICQIGHKLATDLDLLRHTITPNMDDREFFIRKAIGWALREAAYQHPDWVRAFVDEHRDRLSGLSRREALKRIGPSPAPDSAAPGGTLR